MPEFDRLWIVNRLTLYDAYQGQVKEDVADCLKEIDRLKADNERLNREAVLASAQAARMKVVCEAVHDWLPSPMGNIEADAKLAATFGKYLSDPDTAEVLERERKRDAVIQAARVWSEMGKTAVHDEPTDNLVRAIFDLNDCEED